MVDYYTKYTSNIHRGDYSNAVITNTEYDQVRKIVKDFIHAEKENEIVYTSGSTEALNMVAFGFFKDKLNSDDEILITKSEHASNVLPWQVLENEGHGKVKYMELDSNHALTLENVQKAIDIISKFSAKRKQVVFSGEPYIGATTGYMSFPTEIEVGGATIFVIDVERFEKV